MSVPAACATMSNSTQNTAQTTPRDAKRLKVSQGLPLFVELFAGKATLSRAMIQAGFEVIGIDHVAESPMAPIVSLDLTTSSGQKILWESSPMIVFGLRTWASHVAHQVVLVIGQLQLVFNAWGCHRQNPFVQQIIHWGCRHFLSLIASKFEKLMHCMHWGWRSS